MAKKETAFGSGPGYGFYKNEGKRIAKERDMAALEEMIQILQGDSIVNRQRAAAALRCASDHSLDLFFPYLDQLLNAAKDPKHPAVARTTMRIFSMITVPEVLQGEIVDLAFHYLSDLKETIAVRVFAMTVISNHLEAYPDLANELEIVLKSGWDSGSAGYKNRALKIAGKHGLNM